MEKVTEMVPHRQAPHDDRAGEVEEPGCLAVAITIFVLSFLGAVLIALVIL